MGIVGDSVLLMCGHCNSFSVLLEFCVCVRLCLSNGSTVAFLHLLFVVVVLTEVDQLTRDAQHALRRTMEKYMATCRIILCCNSTSKVIPAIRSRCLGVRVAAPKVEEVSSTCIVFGVNSRNVEYISEERRDTKLTNYHIPLVL